RMDIDFPLVLVVLTLVTGVIWLADKLVLKKRRLAAAGAEDAPAEEAPAEPWLVDISRSFFPVLAVVLVLRSFLVEPFQIPSGSMLPTLEVGDFILVNKFSYGLRLPVAGTKVVDLADPARGDVMVFKYPEDGKTNYIKRVIGLPGDHIRYRNKELFVNGDKVASQFVAKLPPVELRREYLGDVEHDIFLTMGRQSGSGEGEWV